MISKNNTNKDGSDLSSSSNFTISNYSELEALRMEMESNCDFSNETINSIMNSEKIKKERDLIDLVSNLIMERIEQLLEKDTDELVRILIENKLFRDENTGLKKQITELENKIQNLSTRLTFLETNHYNNYNNHNDYNWYTSSPSTTGWTITSNLINTVDKTTESEDISLSNKNPDLNQPKAL